ncbi:MAG: Bax inhibitor-1/YccA family protein [Puniceicoccales bacterium]|nr:Bax inhibitor-1/YccA family protein [Puniceicoccales bacterium]
MTGLALHVKGLMMNRYSSTNPVMREGAFRAVSGSSAYGSMTASGTFNRTGILLALVFLAAIFSWSFPYADFAAIGSKLAIFSVVGLILAVVTMLRMDWAPYTAPVYAVAEGLVLGSLSRLFNVSYPGIIVQAVALTFSIFAVMLVLYRFRIVRVTDRFRMFVVAATLGILVVYLVSALMRLFGSSGLGFVHQPTTFGLLFSLFVVFIAALNLMMNFDFVEQVSRYGAPKYMEWYAAFGLVVTLIWLYVEVLNFLAKLRQSR